MFRINLSLRINGSLNIYVFDLVCELSFTFIRTLDVAVAVHGWEKPILGYLISTGVTVFYSAVALSVKCPTVESKRWARP